MEEKVQPFQHLMSRAVLIAALPTLSGKHRTEQMGCAPGPESARLGARKESSAQTWVLSMQLSPSLVPRYLDDETLGQSQLLNSRPREA